MSDGEDSKEIRERPIIDPSGKQVGVEIIPPGHKSGIKLEDEDYSPDMVNLTKALITNPGARSLTPGPKDQSENR